MAIHIPSNLYSGGNVTLDNTPYLRIAMQQKARQQAIGEAAYRHYSQLPDKLNSAGVRDQDWEDPNGNGGIGRDIENTKRFFIENSKDIIKGGRANIQYSKMMQDNFRKVQASKDIGKDNLKIGQEFLKPNGWKPRPSDASTIHSMDLSMYDPASKKEDGSRYGMHDLSMAAVPYTPERESAFQKNVFNGITPQIDTETKPIIDNDSGKMYNTYKHKPEDILRVGENASRMVTSDKTMGYHYEDLLSDKDAVKIASDMLSKVSGTRVEATTPQQLAAGLAMDKAEKFTSQKEETNQALVYKRKLELQKEREAAQLKRTNIIESGKNSRTKVIAGRYGITDPYVEIQKKIIDVPNPTVSEYDPTSIYGLMADKESSAKFAPFTGMSEQEIQDQVGKKDKDDRRAIPTVTKMIDGKRVEGLNAGVDGKLYDAKGNPVDRMQGVRNKAQRLGPTLKQQSKGTLEILPTEKQSSEEKIKGTNKKLF